MQNLVNGKIDDEVLCTLCLQSLPVNFQHSHAAFAVILLVMADKINDFSTFSIIASLSVDNVSNTEIRYFCDYAAKLTKHCSRLTRQSHGFGTRSVSKDQRKFGNKPLDQRLC
ncbi:hypothetical protein TNCT_498741 [Trichonephila clavata]|uniref:Uncharacterized protein n=1 Tax=Trichonephila clavata TaxID=2740835 RepID=A0A8X6LN52_TRICU|nr:hypothetical protein TNCT_498741 [Trichonephila clavata]